MTSSTAPLHARLRELGEKATPGKRCVDRDDRDGMEWNNHIAFADRSGHTLCFMAHGTADEQDEWDANAELIAETDPQTIIGLLDEIEGLKRQEAESVRIQQEKNAAWEKDLDALASAESQLQDMTAQVAVLVEAIKPFARIVSWSGTTFSDISADRCGVEIALNFPHGKSTSKLAYKDLRVLADSIENLPSSAAALLKRLGEAERKVAELAGGLVAVSELKEAAEAELAEARGQRRTAGTVEVCEKCHEFQVIWACDGDLVKVWETCSDKTCPIRSTAPEAGGVNAVAKQQFPQPEDSVLPREYSERR